MREWESEPDLDPYGESEKNDYSDQDDDEEKEDSDTDTEVRSWPRHALYLL